MRTIIAGPRDYYDYKSLLEAIDKITWEITEVISGKATGVDALGERWAKEHNIPVKPFPADWIKYGKRAGSMRNAQMADYAEALLALYDYGRKTPGTTNMIKVATEKKLIIYVHPIMTPDGM
jgi:hypothetical protein